MQDVLEAERTQANRNRRGIHIGEGFAMPAAKLLAPVDEDIILDPTLAHLAPIGSHQHQGFLEQVLDHQSRRLARVIHHSDIEQAVGELPHQARRVVRFDVDRDRLGIFSHPRNPLQDQAVP